MGGFTSKLGDFFSTLFGDSEREHDKERTVDFCTVKSHCCAPCLTTHGELSLSCVMGRGTAKKSNSWRRWQTSCNGFCHAPPKKRTAKICPLPCATPTNARQTHCFGQLYWSLCRAPHQQTHGKGTIPADCFWSLCRAPSLNSRQNDLCNLFFVFHV